NSILQQEVKKAKILEENKRFDEAKSLWLDIIEYSILFAEKTPELKEETASMIKDKANALMAHVKELESFINEKKNDAQKNNEIMPELENKINKKSNDAFKEQEKLEDKSKVENDDKEEHSNINNAKEENISQEKIAKDDSKKFIEVGTEKITIPNDFPLVEITPDDSFKPPEIQPEKIQIDKVREYVNSKDSNSKNGHKIENNGESNQE
ncbi:MAG: hypothetical protein ACTSVI_11565, partial [Promethearchaeota archaeon]